MAFHPVAPTKCAFLEPIVKSQLQKWDMAKASSFQVFRYTKYYHRMAGQDLVLDLLNDPVAQQHLKVKLKNGEWAPLTGHKVVAVDVETVPCTATRMDVFDKVVDPSLGAEPPLTRSAAGDLVKRMEDVRDGFQIHDNLREMLLCDDSDNAELYSDAEKSEFLWRVFQHICLGGPCCQYEDNIQPYLDTTKQLYKELITVQKVSPDAVQLAVASTVFCIKSFTTEAGGLQLFPKPSRNSFCYVSVDPLRRLLRVWYHAFIPYW